MREQRASTKLRVLTDNSIISDAHTQSVAVVFGTFVWFISASISLYVRIKCVMKKKNKVMIYQETKKKYNDSSEKKKHFFFKFSPKHSVTSVENQK